MAGQLVINNANGKKLTITHPDGEDDLTINSNEITKTDLSNVNDSDILNKIKNVDGSESGLDADTVDGKQASDLANVNLDNVNDSDILNKIKNVDGSGSGLDADKLDGLNSTQFLRRDITGNMNADLQMYNHNLKFNNGTYESRVVLQGDDNFVIYTPFHTLHFGITNDEPVKIDGSPILINEGTTLDTNGYLKLNNGLIIQWGKYGIGVNTTATVTFPIAFPNDVFNVSFGTTYPGQNKISVSLNITTLDVNGFTFYNWDTSRGSYINYISIGY
jgi:hypothetical protein